MPRRVLDVDDLICNVHKYFTAEKENGGPLKSVMSVQQRVCDALGISEKKLRGVLRNQDSELPKEDHRKTRPSLKTNDMSEERKFEIRNTIYQMRAKKEHVTLSAILSKLKEKEFGDIGKTSLWKVLRNIGFKFKREDNRKALCERSSVVHKRIDFLRKYSKLKEEGANFIYLDETWIFSKGATKRIWQDDSVKSIKHTDGEGKRHIILHAGGKAGFIEGADLIFSSKSKSSDYHDNMNTEMFIKWLREKLLPSLSEPSVIILDNAPYHSEILNKNPTNSWNVNKIKEWLTNEKIPFLDYMLKSELLHLTKMHAKPKIFVVDQIIESYGHRILRLPPYHCQFNPIEYIWGISKQYYDNHIGPNGYRDEAVWETWRNALSVSTPEIWRNCIFKCEKLIEEWWIRENKINEISPIVITLNGDDSDYDDDDDDIMDNDD